MLGDTGEYPGIILFFLFTLTLKSAVGVSRSIFLSTCTGHSSSPSLSPPQLRSSAVQYMAKPKLLRRALGSYTVKHIDKTIWRGDCVLMRPSDASKQSYVARVEQIEADGRGENVRVQVRWYYRPEESIGGRRQFHGSKEVFLSDHFDIQSADTIEGKCTVHSLKSYTKLDAVGSDDFFCRSEYNSSTGAFNPDRVAVYCKCEMPYNPDDLMIQCEGCSDWFHPNCIDVNPEEAERLDHFYCLDCSPENKRKLHNSRVSTRGTDAKVDTKRCRSDTYEK